MSLDRYESLFFNANLKEALKTTNNAERETHGAI